MPELPRRFGPYVLLETLGQGSMGEVYLARPARVGTGFPQRLVIKRLLSDLATEDFVRRFRHEATIATRIESPRVTRVFDVGKVGDEIYFAMELVSGWSLGRVLKRFKELGRVMPISTAIDCAAGILEGLAALHEVKDERGIPMGFVHRDISPKNVMIGFDGAPKLIDLGLGKSKVQDWKTATGACMGTPGYMSPEQAFGREVDSRSDLYSAATILFELLTNEPYIPRGSLASMLVASGSPKFRLPSSIRPGIPRELDRLIEAALSPDPTRRPGSARAFLQAFEPATQTHERPATLADLVGAEPPEELTRAVTRFEASVIPGDLMEPTDIKTVTWARRPMEMESTEPTLEARQPPISGLARSRPSRWLWIVAGSAVIVLPAMFLLGVETQKLRIVTPAESRPVELPPVVTAAVPSGEERPNAAPGSGEPSSAEPTRAQKTEPKRPAESPGPVDRALPTPSMKRRAPRDLRRFGAAAQEPARAEKLDKPESSRVDGLVDGSARAAADLVVQRATSLKRREKELTQVELDDLDEIITDASLIRTAKRIDERALRALEARLRRLEGAHE
ncbi:MAG: protein kinase [Deltaproteobacteria bacterium]|nr:protein kinase [Deltaproteobacteria bacterium]